MLTLIDGHEVIRLFGGLLVSQEVFQMKHKYFRRCLGFPDLEQSKQITHMVDLESP